MFPAVASTLSCCERKHCIYSSVLLINKSSKRFLKVADLSLSHPPTNIIMLLSYVLAEYFQCFKWLNWFKTLWHAVTWALPTSSTRALYILDTLEFGSLKHLRHLGGSYLEDFIYFKLSNIFATLALIHITVADTSPIPGGNYLLKINNRKTISNAWNISKVSNKDNVVLVSLLLTLNIKL